ncbi:serine/threonine-protein kinase [Geminocystis herdmanii]|uniref:serine/threonine-protein kinase n=1 Tax=Geminocystis herdmanii TaxID=669359 RepID=UPI00034B6A61|nr:serine/threonine-protein kinase [Geminocystis herdmanii]
MNNQLLFKMLEGENIDNKYYLKRLLGSGGFGGVYLADEVVRDRFIRELAVKLIITDNPDKQLDELIFSTTLKQQNLLDCYTCGECTLNNFEFLYLLMEKADYSLEDELKKGKLPEEKVKQLVLDIAKGLDYLHRQNPVIVHRDLKPGNILKVGDKWKISDFGLVRSVQNNSTKTTTLMGSMGYAPPEAYEGKISSAWDMWSFGVVIYETLTGELPFNSETPLALMKEVVNKEVNVSQIPEFWQNIIEGCLSKENKKRFTITNLLEKLENKININTGQKEKIFTLLEINENIVDSSLEDAKFYFNRAKKYKELKQYDKAIIDYTKAIELDPNYISAYYNRGDAYEELNQYEKAIIDYTKAFELVPDYTKARKLLDIYTKIIELNPNDATAYNNRGDAYEKFKLSEKAIIDYTKAIELDPNNANAYNNRGDAYKKLEQYEEAIIDYTKAIELDPNYTYAYNNRGLTYYYLNQYEKAIIDCTKAIELAPNYGYYYEKRAKIYEKLEQYEKAIMDYTKAIELYPTNKYYYGDRAKIYEKLEQYEKAIIDYTRAIKLDPNYTTAIDNRNALEAKMKK